MEGILFIQFLHHLLIKRRKPTESMQKAIIKMKGYLIEDKPYLGLLQKEE
jgi:hypothetical protein